MDHKTIRTGAFHLLAGLLTVFLFAWMALPQTVFAHASLTKAEPAADSVLAEAPDAVRLTFNQRLDEGLYAIKVVDETGQEVTADDAVLSEDRKAVSLALPVLRPGTYTVSYQVMSADGHSVNGSYSFRIEAAAAGHTGEDGGQDPGGQDPQGRAQGDGDAHGQHGQMEHNDANGGHDHHGQTGQSADGGHADDHAGADAHEGHDQHGAHDGHDHGGASGDAGHDGHGETGAESSHAHHAHGQGAVDNGHGHSGTAPVPQRSGGVSGREVLLHGVKAVYLVSLLLFAGLALWQLWRGFDVAVKAAGGSPAGGSAEEAAGRLSSGQSESARRRLDAWQWNALRVFVLALIAWIGIELPQLMNGWTADDWASLARTSLGRLWGVQLVMAAAGLVAAGMAGMRQEAGKPPWQRYVAAALALLFLAAKTTVGHAAAAEPAWASTALDFLHLLAASLWAGGLLILLILWRTGREQLTAFLTTFSRFAWISILVLAASGVIMTFLLLPGIAYLQYGAWGTALLVKIAVVVLVIPVAAVIRRQMKRSGLPAGKLVAADFTLALAIVVIAAVLSGLSPVPENKPLHWHVMGSDIHMTADISPNHPGTNRFAVKVWLPEEGGAPERVQLQLVSLSGGTGGSGGSDGEDPMPIDVPLAPAEDLGEVDFFPGFTRYDYAAEGNWLASAGDWQVRVLVTAPGGNTYMFNHEMRIY